MLKTNRSAAKRFKITASGKIKRFKAGKSHLLTKKERKRKRQLRRPDLLDSSNKKLVKRLLPYGG